MCSEDIQQQILTALQGIERRLGSDEYEYGPIMVAGGAFFNTYSIRSPWNTECEWGLYLTTCRGTTPSGTVIISSANPGIGLFNNTTPAPTFGLFGANENNVFEGLYLTISTTQSYTPEIHWQPLGRGGSVYIEVDMSSGQGYVHIAFRRKLERVIPDKPRQRPHAHTPLSRRALRMMPAQSQQVAGFEAQYPHSDAPYQHAGMPMVPSRGLGQVPATQDTAVARHGVFPMGRSNKNGRG